MDTAGEEVPLRFQDDEEFHEFRVFTLNCWGIRGISKNRKERMQAIANFLSRGEYDIVLLQEVWTNEDYERIRLTVQDALPHSHFFDNGIIGSGTCIFSRAQINDATFHEFTMNGYPHKIWHGDWFGGKGLGVCQIYLKGFDIHVYTSHYHAEYDRNQDVYLGHRVIHALESAQWIKLASSSADLTIYGGDFNTEPSDVPYKLVRRITPLNDTWEEANKTLEGGETCDTPENSYATSTQLRKCPKGKRIDYIMYRSGPNIEAGTVQCSLPLPQRVPRKNFSFSDHEAVSATIRARKTKSSFLRAPEFRRLASIQNRNESIAAINEALQILIRTERDVVKNQVMYLTLSGIFLVFFIISFLPMWFINVDYHVAMEVCLFLPRFLITSILIFLFLMGTVFNQRERNAISSARASLRLILEQDIKNNPFI